MDPPTDVGAGSIWSRLRRRKVVQWALAYAAGAWGLLQGLQFLAEAFDWSNLALKLGTVAALLGLPLAVALAWFRGERGVQRATRAEFAVVTLLLLVSAGLLWYYHHAAVRSVPQMATTATTAAPAPAAIPTDHSIAVLPFVNMSTDTEQEYFADGISEELLNLLARVPRLRVVARTSSFTFKGKEADIAEIATRLNVAHVLEGSVRRSGDKLRVTAQLIRAADSSSLWSQTYDRQMADVFEVQDEIAAAVVAELRIKLLEGGPKVRATDPKAYALVLQARQLGLQATPEGFERSIALFQQALAADPDDAEALAGLAGVYANQANFGLRPVDEGYQLARDTARKALALDPDSAAAHAALGWIAMSYDDEFATAARHFERALSLEPANTDIIRNAAVLASYLDRLDTAIALGEYVTARDPVNPVGYANLGAFYLYAGRLDEAIASYRTALSLSPGYGSAEYSIGEALLRKGDPAGALAAMQKEPDKIWRTIGLPMTWHALGDVAASDAALAELIREHAKDAPYNIAYVLAFRGDADRAFDWLDKAVAYHDSGLSEIAVMQLFANIHRDPRWLPFLRRLGMAPEQLAAIKFDVKLPE